MIDLGIIQIPLEMINVVVILTALLLAARHIGFDIIAAIGGIVAIVYGVKVALYEEEIVVSAHQFGVTEGWLLMIAGGFLLYRGTDSFFNKGDVNTWK